jgi:hypothetical protein
MPGEKAITPKPWPPRAVNDTVRDTLVTMSKHLRDRYPSDQEVTRDLREQVEIHKARAEAWELCADMLLAKLMANG